MAKKLQEEIKQTRPFELVEGEAILNLHRTSDCLHRQTQLMLKPYGLTGTQYNALRILRGAGGEGLACREIGARLVSHDPDITRLLNRLEKRGLIARRRNAKDRRVVYTKIEAAGMQLLHQLDPLMRDSIRDALQHISHERLVLLIDLLEEARETCD